MVDLSETWARTDNVDFVLILVPYLQNKEMKFLYVCVSPTHIYIHMYTYVYMYVFTYIYKCGCVYLNIYIWVKLTIAGKQNLNGLRKWSREWQFCNLFYILHSEEEE